MGSFNIGKPEAIEWIHQHFRKGETCLDVGACNGKWSRLLEGYLKIDAVEAFAPNIFQNHLQTRYNRVYKADIRELEYEPYDLIIFGDVLEHMSVEDAQKVLAYAWTRCRDLIVAVPFMHDQGEKYGNPYEVHVQNDLTHERVLERYPGLAPIFLTDIYGYYTKGGKA